MSNQNTEVTVHLPNKPQQIGRIILNGYNIEPGGALGRRGAMRSFKIVKGNFWDFWDTQSALTIRDETGAESSIRIYALPVEREGSGFVEFL